MENVYYILKELLEDLTKLKGYLRHKIFHIVTISLLLAIVFILFKFYFQKQLLVAETRNLAAYHETLKSSRDYDKFYTDIENMRKYISDDEVESKLELTTQVEVIRSLQNIQLLLEEGKLSEADQALNEASSIHGDKLKNVNSDIYEVVKADVETYKAGMKRVEELVAGKKTRYRTIKEMVIKSSSFRSNTVAETFSREVSVYLGLPVENPKPVKVEGQPDSEGLIDIPIPQPTTQSA